MPFVRAKVNLPVTKAKELEIKTRAGKAIERIPGKSEAYLLLAIEPEQRLYLRGDGDQKIAYIEASIFGNEDHMGFDAFSAELTGIFHDTLGIPQENIYIHYEDIGAWAVNGMFIDRRQFG